MDVENIRALDEKLSVFQTNSCNFVKKKNFKQSFFYHLLIFKNVVKKNHTTNF